VRHVRMLGLCLVAALALGAYAVSSASALEWGKCEFAGPGHNYTGPNCAKSEKAKPKGSGEYEWRKATEVAEKRVAEGKSPGVPFTGESPEGAGGVLTTGLADCEPGEYAKQRVTRQKCEEGGGHYYVPNSTIKIKCLDEHAEGTTEGKNKVAGVQVTFTGCEVLAAPCTGIHGEAEGEIKTNLLKGKLGWISKPAKEVGVVLEPAGKPKTFAEFTCLKGYQHITVAQGNKKEGAWYTSAGCYGECPGTLPEEEKHGGYDRIISPITPVNEMTEEFTQVYTVTEGRNQPEKLEGKPRYQLEDFIEVPAGSTVWENAGEEITNVNTPEEAGEIKA
jgi:hypothetical protein